MRYALPVLCLGLSATLMAGCYGSKVPLGDSREATINAKLLGDWLGQWEGDPVRVMVRKFNDREYFVSFAIGDDQAALTRAYSVPVGDVHFMNLQNVNAAKGQDRTFVFARYELTQDGALVVRFLDKEPLLKGRRFESSDDFRRFVKDHLDDEDLYTEAVRLKRVRDLRMKIEPKG